MKGLKLVELTLIFLCITWVTVQPAEKSLPKGEVKRNTLQQDQRQEDETPVMDEEGKETEEAAEEEETDPETSESGSPKLKQSLFDEIITIKYEDIFPPAEKVALVSKPKKPEIPLSDEPVDVKGTRLLWMA